MIIHLDWVLRAPGADALRCATIAWAIVGGVTTPDILASGDWPELQPWKVEEIGTTPKFSYFNTFKHAFTVKDLRFSTDGRHVATVEERDGWHVWHDGIVGERFDELEPRGIAHSPDSRRLAFGARKGDAWRMVLDGKEELAWDNVSEPVFSPDSRHLAYAAVSKGRMAVIVDGQEGRWFGAIYTLEFLPDSSAVFYIAQQAESEVLMVGDREQAEHRSIRECAPSPRGDFALLVSDRPRLDPAKYPPRFHLNSGTHVAGRRLGTEKMRFVYQGTEDRSYDQTAFLAVSPGGTHVAYVAFQGDEEFVVLNGTEQKRYPGRSSIEGIVEPPVFSPDGTRLAYAASSGKHQQHVVLDGVEQEPFDSIGDNTLAFSPDSKRFCYLAQRGRKAFMVVDGRPGPAVGVADPFLLRQPASFSPDSQHLVYSLGGSCLVIDDMPYRCRKGFIVSPARFVAPGDFQFHWLGRDRKIELVRCRL